MKQIDNTILLKIFQGLEWDSITMSYKDHRQLSRELIAIGSPTSFLTPAKAKQVQECGNFLQFTHAPSAGSTHLTGANFCGFRLCPMCAWRKRVKVFEVYRRAIFSIDKAPQQSYVHITLTIPNPAITSSLALRSDLDKLCNSYRRFRRRLHYAHDGQYCRGTHAQLEVTINNSTSTWHPHIHMLALVDQRFYKEQSRLIAMWRECLASEGLTGGLYIQQVKANDANLHRAVAEVCKYAISFTDKKGMLLIKSTQQYQALSCALHNRRTSWDTGSIKEAKRAVVDSDITPEDLKEAEDILYKYNLGYHKDGYILKSTLVLKKDDRGSWSTYEIRAD
jgi:hypothetical protein